jgi:CRISP-associated protein Cas1
MTSINLTDVQKAYAESCARYEKLVEKILAGGDTLILSGYGCSLRVVNDFLSVYPGKYHATQEPEIPETLQLYRGQKNVKRIIVLTGRGIISVSAMKWMSEQDIVLLLIDDFGDIVLSLPPMSDPDAKLRRAQYHACDTGIDIHIARGLIYRKTIAQIEMLKTLAERKYKRNFKGYRLRRVWDGPAWELLEDGLGELDRMKDIRTILTLEARLANVYWDNFVGIPIKWNSKDAKTIPPHWRQCEGRLSSLSTNRTAQHATNPYQAVTNYAYALLHGQCKQVLASQGFDTACGFLHSDLLHRDSLVYDLMECHRSHTDRLVLDFFTGNVLSKGDFMSSKTGECRFNPQFSRYVVASCRLDQVGIDDSASWLRSCLV